MRQVLLLAGCASVEVAGDATYDVARQTAIAQVRDHHNFGTSTWSQRFTQPDKLAKRARKQTKNLEVKETMKAFNGAPLIGDGDLDVELVVREKAFGKDPVLSYDALFGFDAEEYRGEPNKNDMFAKLSREDYSSRGTKGHTTKQQNLFPDKKNDKAEEVQAKIQEYLDRYNINNFKPDALHGHDRANVVIPTSMLQRTEAATLSLDIVGSNQVKYDDELVAPNIQRHKKIAQADAGAVPRFVKDQWRASNVATTNNLENVQIRRQLDFGEGEAIEKTFAAWDASAHDKVRNEFENANAEQREAKQDLAWEAAKHNIIALSGSPSMVDDDLMNVDDVKFIKGASHGSSLSMAELDKTYEIGVRTFAEVTNCARKTFMTVFNMDCVIDELTENTNGCLAYQMPTKDQLVSPDTKRRVRVWLKNVAGRKIDDVLEELSKDYPEGDIDAKKPDFLSSVRRTAHSLCKLDLGVKFEAFRVLGKGLRKLVKEAHEKESSQSSLLQMSWQDTRGEVLTLDDDTVTRGLLKANDHVLGGSESFDQDYSPDDDEKAKKDDEQDRLDTSANGQAIEPSWAANPDNLYR